MPQGWSIRILSCFNVNLSGGYGKRPEPTGHATYPQPLCVSIRRKITLKILPESLKKMKTKILTFILSLTVMLTFAQTSEHLSFKGVPIDGTLNEYVDNMKKSGFTHISSENGVALLKGDFAAYKDCIIGVATLKQKDLVSKITVIFPEKDTWSSLSSNYYNLKELLSEKYGEPSEVVEKFDTYSEPKDDNSKMHEVGMNRCYYYTTFDLENGSIHLSIENDGFSTSFVMLSYYDKINSEIIRQKALDDL